MALAIETAALAAAGDRNRIKKKTNVLKMYQSVCFLVNKEGHFKTFSTKKEKGKLAGTRSQLYRKLWCWATAHFLQNGTRYNEKQRENTESTKKTLFRQTQNRRAARASLHTFSRISIAIRKTKEKRNLSNFRFSTHIVTDRAENWHTSTTPSGQ